LTITLIIFAVGARNSHHYWLFMIATGILFLAMAVMCMAKAKRLTFSRKNLNFSLRRSSICGRQFVFSSKNNFVRYEEKTFDKIVSINVSQTGRLDTYNDTRYFYVSIFYIKGVDEMEVSEIRFGDSKERRTVELKVKQINAYMGELLDHVEELEKLCHGPTRWDGSDGRNRNRMNA
jgi:hypothetical protein